MPSARLLLTLFQWVREYRHWKNALERKSTWVVIGAGLLMLMGLKAVILPAVASRSVNVIAEGYGIDMEVGDWSAGLVDFNASAKDVVVKVAGSYSQSELLTIDEMELDLSVWRALRGKGWIHEVKVSGPKLYLERQLDGSWNWHELGTLGGDAQPSAEDAESNSQDSSGSRGAVTATMIATATPTKTKESKSAFNLSRLRIEGMKLEWVENLPGNSGGGLINEQRATLFFDDMEVTAQDVVGMLDLRPQPTRLKVAARTADGKISMSGQANFFRWSQESAPEKGPRNASSKIVWSPTFDIKLYLENFGAGGFARLTPEVAVRPARGSMSGTVDLALQDYQLECNANLELQDVTFAANRSSPLLARRGAQVERELEKLRPVSGRYQFACGGLGTEVGFRPVHAFQTRIIREALSEAPLTTRAAAAADHTRYTTEPLEPEYRPTVASMTDGVDSELVGWLNFATKLRKGRTKAEEKIRAFTGFEGAFR